MVLVCAIQSHDLSFNQEMLLSESLPKRPNSEVTDVHAMQAKHEKPDSLGYKGEGERGASATWSVSRPRSMPSSSEANVADGGSVQAWLVIMASSNVCAAAPSGTPFVCGDDDDSVFMRARRDEHYTD